MNKEAKDLNDLLISAYEKVADMEQHMLIGLEHTDVTISELHIMEFIGAASDEGRTISDIAVRFSKTPPSITVAIKKLESRGYVEKIRSIKDGRMVHVILTRAGRRVDAAHRYFHRNMGNQLLKRMGEEDRSALINGLKVLVEFFDHTLDNFEKKSSI
jgi:DNA-binding MarR family transcriptional regulator